MIKATNPKARSITEIVDAVEAAAGVPPGSIRDIMNRRTRDVSLARHVAYYVARRETRLSFAAIARECGALDHKAILYGFNRVSIAVAKGGGEDAPVICRTLRKVAPELLP